ncbi:hypothetical protein F3Y22_tig00111708pilonHSYRG00398 [Hibiscus syriacus]|uniref:Reverse transcriptase domain-containing protein n=1 Tax=Hibiscus syriacus TaxID=106335 RepID=A0A6A2XG97_HIBSY|nr:hypothetical protein F3Y22_tig00111708pilonHSYRG00398 [Hibiscus syriacus]
MIAKEVTNEEIKEAIFSQGNDKAPGPDGYSVLFFKKAWSVVDNDVLKAVKYFFQESFIYPAFNSTTIALIPKMPNPSKGRSIVDNTLLAQEFVKGYGRKSLSPRCALKIDLQKAFDSINWDFISAVLNSLEFPSKVIDWIIACYSNARYSIAFNGTLIGYFKGAKGIRQGDLLSPILFVLIMNVLSNLLNTAASKGMLSFHPKCKNIGSLTFLDYFYEFSGLKLNAGKCELFTAGISHHIFESIISFTGFKQRRLPVCYLGVPLVTKKLTEKDCQALIDNIKNRIHQWSSKNMSYAGRVELIKTVLYSVANYWCRQLILPPSIIKKIEQLCSRFFWKGSDSKATGARVSWRKICNPKSKGGLGLKDIKTWNCASLIQLTRKLFAGEGSLWVAWTLSNIIKNQDFWTMPEPHNASWIFKRILKLRTITRMLTLSSATNTAQIWEDIRPKNSKVSWHKLIWFSLHVYSFHLEFSAPTVRVKFCFLLMVWSAGMGSIFLEGKSLISTILRLSWCGFNYTIWEERNRRFFTGKSRSNEEIVNNVKMIVGTVLSDRCLMATLSLPFASTGILPATTTLTPSFYDETCPEVFSVIRRIIEDACCRILDHCQTS